MTAACAFNGTLWGGDSWVRFIELSVSLNVTVGLIPSN